MPNIAYLNFYYEKTATVNHLYEDALTFTARTDGFILTLNADTSDDNVYHFNVSYDNGMTWTAITFDTDRQTRYSFNEINAGESIMINGTNNRSFWEDEIYFICNANKSCDLSGNIMTLINPTTYNTITTIPYDDQFRELFYGLNVVDASRLKLPATTLKPHCYNGMFHGCTLLTTPPQLPATTLVFGCYYEMFYGCTSLTTPPALPATTLANICYYEMFYGCTSLTTPPALPATTLAQSCYSQMFRGCTSLTTAPELPATTLAQGCYTSMFFGCTSLITAPVLPATTLAPGCYATMFYECTNINYIRILCTESNPSTSNLNDWVSFVAPTGTFIKDANATYLIDDTSGVPIGWTVYNEGEQIIQNFNITLTVDPEGSGVVYGNGIYATGQTVTLIAQPAEGYIFDGWYYNGSLQSSNATWSFIPTYDPQVGYNINFTAKFIVDPTVYYDVTLTQDPNIGATLIGAGRYTENTMVTVSASEMQGYNFLGWYRNNQLLSNTYNYTFSITQNMELTAKYEEIDPSIYYTVTTRVEPILGGTVTGGGQYLAGDYATVIAYPASGYKFEYWMQNGEIVTTDTSYTFIVNYDTTVYAVFSVIIGYENKYLTIESLNDSNTVYISASSYYYISGTIEYSKNDGPWNSISIYPTTTTIETINTGETIRFRKHNYVQNYNASISINTSFNCNIYGNVMSLIESHIDATQSTDKIFVGVNTSELYSDESFASLFRYLKVVDASNLILPATTLSSACYAGMFEYCTSLTAAPALPATTLSLACYEWMFRNCTSLTAAPALPATTLYRQCYFQMFAGCTSLTTPPALPATTLEVGCYSNMFGLCTSLTTAPELPATTLVTNCYVGMFNGCTSLNNITCLATDISAYECLDYWVENVASNGTFTKAATMTSWPTGNSGIPSGWTVQNAS